MNFFSLTSADLCSLQQATAHYWQHFIVTSSDLCTVQQILSSTVNWSSLQQISPPSSDLLSIIVCKSCFSLQFKSVTALLQSFHRSRFPPICRSRQHSTIKANANPHLIKIRGAWPSQQSIQMSSHPLKYYSINAWWETWYETENLSWLWVKEFHY